MYQVFFKRALDILICVLVLLVIWPLLLLISLAIVIETPGPVMFRQKRVGLHKKHFYIYKFRSMRADSPSDMPTHLLKNPEQYVTRVGRFLRRSSLDELPQLFNILVGHMSIVGPRPALWNQYDLIEERDKYGANDVLPGLTGWAQINGRDELAIDVKARFDGEYVERMSFLFDCRCFFSTFLAVLRQKGVVEGSARKVLIVTNHSYMLYRFRKELISELMKTNEVVLAMPFVGHEDDFKAMGLSCIHTDMERRGLNPLADLKLFRLYRKLLKKERPNLVVTYSIKPNIYGGVACAMAGIPYCVNVQGLGTAFQKKRLVGFVTVLYRFALRKAKAVFFENVGNAREFVERKIIPQQKVTVLSGAGVNLQEYQPVSLDPHEGVRFLYLGRIMKEKGVDELFAAMRRLREETHGGASLELVGFFDEDYTDVVDALVKDGVVTFHGFQKDPRPYYVKADCVVLPSYHEGMSNVLLEAGAMARPVITCNIHGCKEAVLDGESGLLCEPQSEESLYNAMVKFCGLPAEKRRSMGLAARRHIEKVFDKQQIVAQTMEKLFL